MLIDDMIAYAEVDEILNLLEDEYAKKVPEKIRQFFREERDIEYIPKFDAEKPLEEQNLNRTTVIILAILKLNYWCESEEEKKELLEMFDKNEQIKINEQQELEEKYNPDNLFKKRQQETHIKELSLVEYKKENFIQKILSKIASFFKRKL